MLSQNEDEFRKHNQMRFSVVNHCADDSDVNDAAELEC